MAVLYCKAYCSFPQSERSPWYTCSHLQSTRLDTVQLQSVVIYRHLATSSARPAPHSQHVTGPKTEPHLAYELVISVHLRPEELRASRLLNRETKAHCGAFCQLIELTSSIVLERRWTYDGNRELGSRWAVAGLAMR